MPLSTLRGLWHCDPLPLRILVLWKVPRLMLKPHMLHWWGMLSAGYEPLLSLYNTTFRPEISSLNEAKPSTIASNS